MNITFAGTGSGVVSSERNTSCIFVSSNSAKIILDCGDGATGALLRAGIDPSNADALIITHFHPDHFGGLLFLMQTLHLKKRTNPFYLYVPESIGFVKEMLIRSYIFPESIGFPLVVKKINPTEKINISGMEIIPHPNKHMLIHKEALNHHPELEGRAYSLEVSSGDTRIAYSSDIYSLDDLDWALSSKLDLLICEATHIDINNLEAFIKKSYIDLSILTHIDKTTSLEQFKIANDGFSISI
ncbi:ribonuclease Z [bacterium]|nr:ribonuclease Z [bacterium]